MQIHSDEKPYKCCECRKRFSLKEYLDTHKIIHSAMKPFECNECDERFHRNHDLKKHMMRHTGSEPYPCSECNVRCLSKPGLVRHMATHSGTKDHQCCKCGKCLLDHMISASMNNHMRKNLRLICVLYVARRSIIRKITMLILVRIREDSMVDVQHAKQKTLPKPLICWTHPMGVLAHLQDSLNVLNVRSFFLGEVVLQGIWKAIWAQGLLL